jgi:demethylmenaquinone methyltransferase / 2-methoxy-6-polyprenyl-1,4-benzoquinol methylase
MKYSKDPKFIGRMFDEISPSYDRLNHLFSGMQDLRWRKMAIKYLVKTQPKYSCILDLASGSGDLALEMMKLNPDKLYSVDLSSEMLKINKRKVNSEVNIILQADAQSLPFVDNYFDLIGIGFGVRNFEAIEKCIMEISRVLKPGGKFLTIEMFRSSKNGIIQKSFNMYFRKMLPKIGNILSKSDYAYDYLFDSVNSFLTVKEYSNFLEQSGLQIEFIRNNFISIVHTVIASKR